MTDKNDRMRTWVDEPSRVQKGEPKCLKPRSVKEPDLTSSRSANSVEGTAVPKEAEKCPVCGDGCVGDVLDRPSSQEGLADLEALKRKWAMERQVDEYWSGGVLWKYIFRQNDWDKMFEEIGELFNKFFNSCYLFTELDKFKEQLASKNKELRNKEDRIKLFAKTICDMEKEIEHFKKMADDLLQQRNKNICAELDETQNAELARLRKENDLLRKGQSEVFCSVVGEEGVGMSSVGLNAAKLVDDSFNCPEKQIARLSDKPLSAKRRGAR